MKLTQLTPAHAIKLASIAAHAQEFIKTVEHDKDASAAQFDLEAVRGLLTDPQVREVLDDPENKVFLPEPR